MVPSHKAYTVWLCLQGDISCNTDTVILFHSCHQLMCVNFVRKVEYHEVVFVMKCNHMLVINNTIFLVKKEKKNCTRL